MHELAKITGIRSDIEGTEMKVFVPEKNLFNTNKCTEKKGIRNDQRHRRLYWLSS